MHPLKLDTLGGAYSYGKKEETQRKYSVEFKETIILDI